MHPGLFALIGARGRQRLGHILAEQGHIQVGSHRPFGFLRQDAQEQQHREGDPGLAQPQPFFQGTHPQIIGPGGGELPGHGQEAVPIGIGLDHRQQLDLGSAETAQLPVIVLQGRQVDGQVHHGGDHHGSTPPPGLWSCFIKSLPIICPDPSAAVLKSPLIKGDFSVVVKIPPAPLEKRGVILSQLKLPWLIQDNALKSALK